MSIDKPGAETTTSSQQEIEMADKRPQLETQQPALVPATGEHTRPDAETPPAPRTGDRDLDVNGVEQDDDGHPGTGLGPEQQPSGE